MITWRKGFTSCLFLDFELLSVDMVTHIFRWEKKNCVDFKYLLRLTDFRDMWKDCHGEYFRKPSVRNSNPKEGDKNIVTREYYKRCNYWGSRKYPWISRLQVDMTRFGFEFQHYLFFFLKWVIKQNLMNDDDSF